MAQKLIIFLLCAMISVSINAQTDTQNTQDDLPPGWWKVPKTKARFKVGGYVKLDFIYDLDPIRNENLFNVASIPTDGSEGQNAHLNARESRVFVDFRVPSKFGEIRALVEGDFYGANGVFRLRHAMVEVGEKLLIGQWWSNFMDETIIPPTLDFEKPEAYLFARRAMVRYRFNFNNQSYLAIALEDPITRSEAPTEPGEFESPMPDITAKFRLDRNWGHFQLSAFYTLVRYRFDIGGIQEESLWGLNFSGHVTFVEKDKLLYQLVYGHGIARFRGGLSTTVDGNDNLDAPNAFAYTVGYNFYWSDAFSTIVVFNQGLINNTAGQPSTDIENLFYVAVNFVWHFTPKSLMGIEYLHGRREDVSGADGTANRIQFSVRHIFN